MFRGKETTLTAAKDQAANFRRGLRETSCLTGSDNLPLKRDFLQTFITRSEVFQFSCKRPITFGGGMNVRSTASVVSYTLANYFLFRRFPLKNRIPLAFKISLLNGRDRTEELKELSCELPVEEGVDILGSNRCA